MDGYRELALYLGITEPLNGSWLVAICNHYGVTQPVNGSWLQGLANHNSVLTTDNGTWIETLSKHFGGTEPMNGSWLNAMVYHIENAVSPTPTPTLTPTPTPTPTPSTDVNAQAYITSLTNLGFTPTSTQQTAINNLFLNLKGTGSINTTDNMYSDVLILRPFTGGLAATNGLNAVKPTTSPLDFYGMFNGGWTHTISGSTPNGINGYMNNNFVPSLHMTSDTNGGIFCNVLTNMDDGFDMGCQTTTNWTGILIASNYGGQRYSRALTNNQYGVAASFRDAIGFWGSIQINGTAYFQRNTTFTTYTTGGSGRPDRELVSGALNSNGTIGYYTSRRRNFEVVLKDVKTTTRATTLKTIIDTFNTEFGR
jgi:hypothetical protein